MNYRKFSVKNIYINYRIYRTSAPLSALVKCSYINRVLLTANGRGATAPSANQKQTDEIFSKRNERKWSLWLAAVERCCALRAKSSRSLRLL